MCPLLCDTVYQDKLQALREDIPSAALYVGADEGTSKPHCFTNYEPHFNPAQRLDSVIMTPAATAAAATPSTTATATSEVAATATATAAASTSTSTSEAPKAGSVEAIEAQYHAAALAAAPEAKAGRAAAEVSGWRLVQQIVVDDLKYGYKDAKPFYEVSDCLSLNE
jgi:hypothetical protein